MLFNHGKESFQIKMGDRIAQVILEKIASPPVVEVDSLSNTHRVQEALAAQVLRGMEHERKSGIDFPSGAYIHTYRQASRAPNTLILLSVIIPSPQGNKLSRISSTDSHLSNASANMYVSNAIPEKKQIL